MTIYREGKAIRLTYDETLACYNEIRNNYIRQLITDKLEEEEVSFDSYVENGFASEDEFIDAAMSECMKTFNEYFYEYNYSENYAIDKAVETLIDDYDLPQNF